MSSFFIVDESEGSNLEKAIAFSQVLRSHTLRQAQPRRKTKVLIPMGLNKPVFGGVGDVAPYGVDFGW